MTRCAAGFTLIEILCAMALAGVLSSLAYPTYRHALHQARRADAVVAAAQVQMAQARYRAEHTRYGSLADIRVAALSPAGHYRLDIAAPSPDGYELHARAEAGQRADAACRRLKLVVIGSDVVHASGHDERFSNAAAVNRRCWGL